MPTYEITYKHYEGASYCFGETSSAAKYRHFQNLDGCFETFNEFLSAIKSVKKVAPRRGAYDFIERQYGRKFEVGQKVIVSEKGKHQGEAAEVIHPSGGGAYVHVLLDGDTCIFHPMSLKLQQ